MPLLLNIDTATEHASVCISRGKEVLGMKQSQDQKNHASFIQPAIKEVMTATGYQLSAVHAVSVTAGPGSYTGLRVGLATAKGLCYALKKPLILISTLEVMALAAIETVNDKREAPGKKNEIQDFLFCPMIDARRMEVFMALYDDLLQPLLRPAAIILNKNSFAEELSNHTIIFCGSGSIKMQKIIQHPNAFFITAIHNAGNLAVLAAKAFSLSRFADLAYSEPLYLKEFFTAAKP